MPQSIGKALFLTCVTLDFKLFIDSIHILFLLYLLLWFGEFTNKNLQDFIKIYRALIKDILLAPCAVSVAPCRSFNGVFAVRVACAVSVAPWRSFTGVRAVYVGCAVSLAPWCSLTGVRAVWIAYAVSLAP